MESIPLEVIETAEDFFNHVTDEQKEEFLDDYYDEQPPLSKYFHGMVHGCKNEKVMDELELLYLIICRSYQYYGVKIPVIKMDTIGKTLQKTVVIIGKYAITDTMIPDMIVEMNSLIKQDNLMSFINLKVIGPPENPVKYDDISDLLDTYVNTVMLILILNNEMSRHVGKEVN